jgi:hypothetical protein
MLTVVWNRHGFHLVNVLPRGKKWTSSYSIDHILPDIGALRDARDRRKMVVHADNTKSYIAERVKQYMDENSLNSAPYPPYSPDLTSSDFCLFGHVKRMLRGTEFRAAEAFLETVVEILSDIPLETLMDPFYQWMGGFRHALMIIKDMWNREIFYSKHFCLSPTGSEMLRGQLRTLYMQILAIGDHIFRSAILSYPIWCFFGRDEPKNIHADTVIGGGRADLSDEILTMDLF